MVSRSFITVDKEKTSRRPALYLFCGFIRSNESRRAGRMLVERKLTGYLRKKPECQIERVS